LAARGRGRWVIARRLTFCDWFSAHFRNLTPQIAGAKLAKFDFGLQLRVHVLNVVISAGQTQQTNGHRDCTQSDAGKCGFSHLVALFDRHFSFLFQQEHHFRSKSK